MSPVAQFPGPTRPGGLGLRHSPGRPTRPGPAGFARSFAAPTSASRKAEAQRSAAAERHNQG